MSMHRIPLTDVEREGLERHGLKIGIPSQSSDFFRSGVKWAQMWAKYHDLAVNLYDPIRSGLAVLPSEIDYPTIEKISNFVKERHDLFEVKREKYIENNQLVSLLYRGPFELEDMANTVFKEIIAMYSDIRNGINMFSSIPFDTGNCLEIKLIHYPISDLGVAPHKDLSSNRNLIVFFNINGSTNVRTYHDLDGKSEEYYLDHYVKSGDISLMRAPRSIEQDDIRPRHGVGKVLEPRTVLVIREINEELEKVTNAGNWRGF